MYLTPVGTKIVKIAEMNKLKLCFILLLLASPNFSQAKESNDPTEVQLKIQEGVASYYGRKFHLRRTANGEVFNMKK